MKRPSLLLGVVPLRSVVSFAVLLTLVHAAVLSGGAGGPAMARRDSVGGLLVTGFVLVNEASRADAMERMETTAAASHTALLPLVLKKTGSATPFGVQLFAVDPDIVAKSSEVGAGWVRVPFYWAQVEPVNTTPEHYQWPSDFEARLADLSARNIQVILTLGANPWWAATYAGGPIDKVDIGELVQFMEAAVARYGKAPYSIKHWEFYNEPDNGDEFYGERGYGFFGTQPKAYVDTLSAVYRPMKAVDPAVQIVFGGIAYDNWIPEGPFVQDFLDRVLAEGGGAYFDVMNFHYYPAFRDVWDPYGNGIIGKVTFLQRKLAAYGVDKPFVCTEAGFWSDSAHGGSNENQSRYVVQVLTRSMAAEMRALTWFWFIDEVHLGSRKYGLLNPDLSPKPAYFAYQTFSGRMSWVDYVRALAPGKDGSDQIEGYEFDARFSPDRIVVGWTTDGAPHVLMLETSQANVMDKFGGENTVLDGDDGTIDGRVHVSIGPSPVYVTFEP